MKWRKASDPPKKDDWYYIKFGGTKRCAMFRDGEWEAPYPTDNETFIWLDETEEQTTSVDVEQAAKRALRTYTKQPILLHSFDV